MTLKETAEELGIGINLFREFSVCMEGLWNLAHDLDKLTIIQMIIKQNQFSREDVYNRCEDDLYSMKEMFVEIYFVQTMEMRGTCDTKSSNDKMWRFIEYWREL
jgi:hypothetical protein